MNLDAQREVAFQFIAGREEGAYRISVRHGPDWKIVQLWAANDPKLFADPASLSYGLLDATGAARKALLVSLTDAGDGSGRQRIEQKGPLSKLGQADAQPRQRRQLFLQKLRIAHGQLHRFRQQ